MRAIEGAARLSFWIFSVGTVALCRARGPYGTPLDDAAMLMRDDLFDSNSAAPATRAAITAISTRNRIMMTLILHPVHSPRQLNLWDLPSLFSWSPRFQNADLIGARDRVLPDAAAHGRLRRGFELARCTRRMSGPSPSITSARCDSSCRAFSYPGKKPDLLTGARNRLWPTQAVAADFAGLEGWRRVTAAGRSPHGLLRRRLLECTQCRKLVWDD